MKHKLKKFRPYFFALIALLGFTLTLNLLVYFESQGANANIKDHYDGLWYAIITLTTVGYGDLYPTTAGGKLVGLLIVISSIGVLGYLIGKITNNISSYMTNKKLGLHGSSFHNHFVIIGWNDFASQIVTEILKTKNKVVIVTNKKDDIDLIREVHTSDNLFSLFTDFKNYDGLNKVNITASSKIFINFNDDTETLIYIINLQKHFPKLNFVVLLNSAELKETYKSIGVSHTVSKNEIASKLVASYIFEPDVALFTEDLMSTSNNEQDFDLLEFKIIKDNPYLNMDCMKVFVDLKVKFDGVLMGLSREINGTTKLIKNPSKDVKVELNDHIILMANGKAKLDLEKSFNVIEGRI